MDELRAKMLAVEPRWHPCGKTTMVYRNPEGPKALERIAELEAALRKIADVGVLGGPADIARAALAEETSDA